MIISKIEQQKKYKNYYDIYIDDQYIFFLTYREMKLLDIKLDNTITQEKIEYIYNDFIMKRAKNRALNLLQRKDRTKHEMITKLSETGYNDYIIDRVIIFLEEYNYINDYNYVKKYIRINKDRKSIKQIKYELNKKLISKEIISEILESTEINEEVNAYGLLLKKYKNTRQVDIKIRQKMTRYLIQKGYNYRVAYTVIEKLINDLE